VFSLASEPIARIIPPYDASNFLTVLPFVSKIRLPGVESSVNNKGCLQYTPSALDAVKAVYSFI